MNASDFIHKGKGDKRQKKKTPKKHKTTETHSQNPHKNKKQPSLKQD